MPMLVSGAHPVAIVSAVFCIIGCLLIFVMDASGDLRYTEINYSKRCNLVKNDWLQ